MADTNKEPVKPKAKKASKKKSSSSVSPTPTTPESAVSALPTLTPQELKNHEEMLQLARLEYFKDLKNKIVKEKKREISSLDDQIKEYIGPYILIGYDLNNNPVEIVSAQNAAEHDALLERFRRVMYKINQNIMNSNGEDPYGNGNDS